MELSRFVTIGQYIPAASPVHRLDPRTKIAAVTLLMVDRKSTRLNSSHIQKSRMPSSA